MTDKPRVGDGGPAFPTPPQCSDDGMALRDWFIGCALAGLCGQGTVAPSNLIAKAAIAIADEVLLERDKDMSRED